MDLRRSGDYPRHSSKYTDLCALDIELHQLDGGNPVLCKEFIESYGLDF
jgi:hypothetical protein